MAASRELHIEQPDVVFLYKLLRTFPSGNAFCDPLDFSLTFDKYTPTSVGKRTVASKEYRLTPKLELQEINQGSDELIQPPSVNSLVPVLPSLDRITITTEDCVGNERAHIPLGYEHMQKMYLRELRRRNFYWTAGHIRIKADRDRVDPSSAPIVRGSVFLSNDRLQIDLPGTYDFDIFDGWFRTLNDEYTRLNSPDNGSRPPQ